MPKGKLRIKKTDGKKFKVSAAVHDMKLGTAKPLPGDEVLCEVTYSNIQQVADVIGAMKDYKGDELDEPAVEGETAKKGK